MIGDGIAWRSLGYDRLVMKSLAGAATKQHVLSDGTLQELREWSVQFDSGAGLPILNSLTNTLAIGDVTVVRDDGTVEIIEVKGGKAKSSRTVRQKQRMREVVNFINAGSGEMEDKFVEVERLDITPENGLRELGGLLAASEPRGWAGKRISNCAYAECVDFRGKASGEEISARLDELREKEIADWRDGDDKLLHMTSLDLLKFAPNCAPFSIFPFPSRHCVDLMTGAKSYDVSLNLNAVEREFEYRGWMVVKTFKQQLEEEKNEEAVLVVRKDGCEVQIPPGEIIRVWMELLRVSVLIKLCDAHLHRGRSQQEGYSYAVLDGEPSVWN